MSEVAGLNVSKIIKTGGDVSGAGELERLELVTPNADGSQTRTPIPLEGKAQWRAVVSHVGADEYWLAGRVKASAVLECARCLEPTVQPIEARLESLLQYNAKVQHPHRVVQEDGEEIIVFGDPSLDLSGLLAEAFSMELPEVVLHSPDCKGLCITCGTNLNHLPAGTCAANRADCPQLTTPETKPSNPFAGLKELFKD
jgi:uncharacterized protein